MKISSVSCSDYEPQRVEDRIEEALSLIGGLDNYIDSGDTVLLKPNLLSPKSPDSGIITHSNIVKSLINLFQKGGAEVIVGESSGGVSGDDVGSLTSKAFRISGLKEVCQNAGIDLINFDKTDYEIVDNPGTTEETFPLPNLVLEADVFVSLPKLKTHTFTLFTGAIKNLYGCIPGMKKKEYHKLYPNPESFSELVVDILEIINPDLSIMDGIDILHGNGPGEKGKKFHLGTIMASPNPVALDTVAADYLGFSENEVPISRIAGRREIADNLDNIEILGNFNGPKKKLELPKTGILNFLPNWILKPISSSLRANPKINADECKLCGRCSSSCPQETIYEDTEKYRINHENCIKCLCCHEVCPEGAVEVKKHPLFRMISSLVS